MYVHNHVHSTVVVDAVAVAVVVHSLYGDFVSLSPQKKIRCKQNDTDNKQCGACLICIYIFSYIVVWTIHWQFG